MECPFLEKCDQRVNRRHYRLYCVKDFKDCVYYVRFIVKKYPRQWKEEVEGNN